MKVLPWRAWWEEKGKAIKLVLLSQTSNFIAIRRQICLYGFIAELNKVYTLYFSLLLCNLYYAYKKGEELMWYFNKHCIHLCSILKIFYSCCVRKSLNSICSGAELMIWDSIMQKTIVFHTCSARFNPNGVGVDVIVSWWKLLVVQTPKAWKPSCLSGWIWPGLKAEFLLDFSLDLHFYKTCLKKKKKTQNQNQTKTTNQPPAKNIEQTLNFPLIFAPEDISKLSPCRLLEFRQIQSGCCLPLFSLKHLLEMKTVWVWQRNNWKKVTFELQLQFVLWV